MEGTGAKKGDGVTYSRGQTGLDPELAQRLIERGFYLLGAARAPSGTGGSDTGQK